MAKVIYTDIKGNVTTTPPVIDADMYVLGVDSSSTRSGVCLLSVGGRLGFTSAVVRENSESLAEYKIALKKYLEGLIRQYAIKHTAYEEPFIGYAGDAKALYMMASSLEELLVETGLEFSVSSVNNKRWKKQFLNVKLEGGSAVQKEMVRQKAIELVPALKVLEKNGKNYDESDAFGVAYYLAKCVREDALDKMTSKGKPKKFGYDIILAGGAITAGEALKLVDKPRKDGVIVENINSKRNFDLAVYTLMQGKDAVLVLHFNSGKFGDIILKHGAGELAAKNGVLSAIVARKSSAKKTKKKKE